MPSFLMPVGPVGISPQVHCASGSLLTLSGKPYTAPNAGEYMMPAQIATDMRAGVFARAQR